MPLDQLIEDFFQCDAVQRIAGMLDWLGHSGNTVTKTGAAVKATVGMSACPQATDFLRKRRNSYDVMDCAGRVKQDGAFESGWRRF
jgi:hypothetical protein